MTEQEIKAFEHIKDIVELIYDKDTPSSMKGVWMERFNASAEVFEILTGKKIRIHNSKAIIEE